MDHPFRISFAFMIAEEEITNLLVKNTKMCLAALVTLSNLLALTRELCNNTEHQSCSEKQEF